LLAVLTTACARERSPEDAVRDALRAMEEAAEARDVGAVMSFVSPEFSSDAGSSRDDFRNVVRAYLLAHPKLELAVNIESIEFLVDDLARVELSVSSITKGTSSTLGGFDIDLESARIELVRDGERWQVRRADRNATP
jgi:hypothetical protein